MRDSKFASTIRHSVVLVGLFAALSAAACKKKEVPPPAPETTTSAPVATYAVGDKVDVKWNNSWWKGEVLSVDNGKYRVHYTGWSSNWDETVAADRIRALSGESKVGSMAEGTGSADPAASAAPSASASAAASSAPAATAAAYKVGDKVDVNWKGSWYQAKILSAGATYKVHYIGWASSWDESVPASRIRPWTGKASKGSGPN
ncbi:MAG: agenet domain-containing protein [Polyangiaceae bacterium]